MMHQWSGCHANMWGLKRPWENPPHTQITPLSLLSPTSTRNALIKALHWEHGALATEPPGKSLTLMSHEVWLWTSHLTPTSPLPFLFCDKAGYWLPQVASSSRILTEIWPLWLSIFTNPWRTPWVDAPVSLDLGFPACKVRSHSGAVINTTDDTTYSSLLRVHTRLRYNF